MARGNRVVVTGLGLVCGVGNSVDECWQAVISGKTGIDDVRSVDTSLCYAHKGAEVSLENSELSSEDYDRSSLLCIKAAGEALADAGFKITDENSGRVGVILGSCVGGAASIDKYYTDAFKKGETDSADILKMPASAIANNVAGHFGINGVTANIVNACAAGTMSIAYACDLIREGKADAFIAGGSDSFSSLAFSGFHALHALDEDACSPFNRSSGITLGEGSGVLIVESAEHAEKRGAKIYCDVLGSGVSSDAYHITAPRPDGEGQMTAIRRALESSGVDNGEIDYINAHGTGTAKNDEAEFLSLHTLFDGSDRLSVSSTKSMTGHCLGAAGSIEAVFSVKAVCENTVPPTIGYTEDDLEILKEKAGKLDFVPNEKRKKPVEYVMSNSFAFGGNNASIIFSKQPREIPAAPDKKRVFVTGIGELTGGEKTESGMSLKISSADFKAHGIKMAFYRKLDRFSQLQLLSGAMALENARLEITDENAEKTGIVIGTADGPMTEIALFQKNAVEKGVEKGSAFSFPNTVYNAAGGYLSIFAGIKGYNATIANSMQAGLQSICCAVDVLGSGRESVMLAAGTDENTEVEAALYSQLGVLGDGNIYDKNSNGFLLGEGSVTLVLETEESANARGAKKLCEIAGCACAHKSVEWGKISGSEQALCQAVRDACESAGITPDELDAVCGFANGSAAIDDLELAAYRKIFKNGIDVITVKNGGGEARAASAALQAAEAARLLSESKTVEAFRISADLVAQSELESDGLEYILAASFGLGGSYSAVVLKRANGGNYE